MGSDFPSSVQQGLKPRQWAEFLTAVYCAALGRAGALDLLESPCPGPIPHPLEEAVAWGRGCLSPGSGFMKNWWKDSRWLWQLASVI